MRYFIGYLIQGEAARWHIELSKEIASKFKIWNISEKNPPHLTIYYPFETEDISPIKIFLRKWLHDHPISGNVTLSGFSHFENRVVFVDVNIDDSVRKAVEDMKIDLRKIIPPRSINNVNYTTTWNPHATLAYKISEEKIIEILDYVKDFESPTFTKPFDNITVFVWSDNKWLIEESFSTNN
jgi:2'-5' RNA ligase